MISLSGQVLFGGYWEIRGIFLGTARGALWWLNNSAAGHFRCVLARDEQRGDRAEPSNKCCRRVLIAQGQKLKLHQCFKRLNQIFLAYLLLKITALILKWISFKRFPIIQHIKNDSIESIWARWGDRISNTLQVYWLCYVLSIQAAGFWISAESPGLRGSETLLCRNK